MTRLCPRAPLPSTRPPRPYRDTDGLTPEQVQELDDGRDEYLAELYDEDDPEDVVPF